MTYDYISIILNYNSFEFLDKAITTIRNCATGSYRICIVDNNSSREGERNKLKSLASEDTEVLLLKENLGYGMGNNKAVSYMNKRYDSRYIVILNPDIELVDKGTIEGIIKESEINGAAGGQPLVWNYHYSDNARTQINIGKVADYFTLCIQSNLLLRQIFKKRFIDTMFLNEMPYKEHVEYYMPSGAFFIMKTEVFKEINGFDDSTFLYGEETIIAYKLFERGYHMLLCPEYVVKHLQGASTGYDRYSWNKKRLRYLLQSREIYLRKYLKVGNVRVLIFKILLHIDYITRRVYVMLSKALFRSREK